MDFTDRLVALGISQVQFAERLGVSQSAVANYKVRGLPEKAEELLKSLEASGSSGDLFEPGWLVRVSPQGWEGLIVRRDRYEALYGVNPVSWLYWVVEGRKDKDGTYRPFGPALSELPRYLTVVDKEPKWSRAKIDNRLTGEGRLEP